MEAQKQSNPTAIIGKRLLTVAEAARYLGIAPRTLYNTTGRSAQKPPPVKVKRIGKLVRFDINDLDDFIRTL